MEQDIEKTEQDINEYIEDLERRIKECDSIPDSAYSQLLKPIFIANLLSAKQIKKWEDGTK